MKSNKTQAGTTLSQKVTQVSMAQSEYTIYSVYKHLRNVNPKAYEPEVIAIGPYHRDNDDLKMMEDYKLRYLHLLTQRENGNVEKYVSAIKPLEAQARECYAEHISLDSTEFIEMLVLDGCFIIQLVRKFNMPYLREKNDPIFRMDWLIDSLKRDLMLFENQIPFSVLCALFDLIERPNAHLRLVYLFLKFFKIVYPGNVQIGSMDVTPGKIKHLLDLIHCSWITPPLDELGLCEEKRSKENSMDVTPGKIKHLLDLIRRSWIPRLLDRLGLGEEKRSEEKRSKEKGWRFINSATRLREANVKFQRNEGVTSLSDIRFNNGVMLMAPLTIEDRTETFLRNLIAYEQYFQDSFITDYVKFVDCLIDSPKDVEILSRHGIIENWLGDDEVVAKMFNKLTDSVAGGLIYAKIFDSVNKHCEKRRNRWMAKLRRNYLNSPWSIISIIVAVVLLLLTVTQTSFTILQVVQQK